ncbi:MAG: CoA-binding protein [Deltaproteobacteria bacterium]|nr:CoA-binding protein [Deltaproteobacteria bacterium]
MNKVDHFLDRFFRPSSVAIIGATNNFFKMNFRLMQNLVNLNFQGKIYPVNHREEKILGIRAFARLRDIQDRIDLVVIAVPASKALDIVKECDKIGVNQVVIVTGGFSEGGEHGRKLHREIASFVKERGIRIIGPNTLSPINTSNNLAISYNPIRSLKKGGLSFVFQSGFYEPKMNWIFSHLGINKMLDLGNKMDVNEVDALDYFLQDPDTKVIAMHIESLHGDGRDFFDLLKKGSIRKPIIILKSGRTPAGSLAAASHTGAIASENDVIFDSIIRQTAAIRANNMEEFFDLAKAFEFLKLPKGNRLAIITLSGGEGVMATDACEMNGLKMARLDDNTYQRLKGIFPPWEIPLNPIDAGACLEFHLADILTIFNTLAAIPEDENVDCTVMQMPPDFLGLTSTNENFSSEMIGSLKKNYTQALLKIKRAGKPFAMWCTSMDREEDEWIKIYESHYLPVFQSSERAIKAMSALYRYRSLCMRESPDVFSEEKIDRNLMKERGID